MCQRNIDNAIGIISKNIISLSKDKCFPIQQVSASKPIYFYTRHHIPWKPHQHYQLTHNFVRCISNLSSASDRKLCFTLWQLKLCLTGNDKSIYSKIPNCVFSGLWYRYISFIVACKQHRICIIYIVYVTILTIYNCCLNARRFHLLRWWLRMWFYLLQCCMFINTSSYTPINWSIYWFLVCIHSTS